MSKILTQALVHPLFNSTVFFKSLILNLYSQIRKNWLDLSTIAVLALAAALASFQGAQMINPVILDTQAFDVWFESDLPRIFNNMSDRVSNHYRVKVHPLFSLVAFPLTLLATKVFRVDPVVSVKLVISAIAALWVSALFILFRLMGLRRLDAILFSLLASVSSASLFWFVVPETYSFGSLSIVIALCFVVLAETRQFSSLWYAGMSALTLSMTTTNWMVGLLTTFISFPKKKALQVTINAFFLTVVLWTIQKIIFPSAVFFLGDREEKDYVLMAGSGGLWPVLKSFLSHTMVMPNINLLTEKYTLPHWPVLSVQFSMPGSGSAYGTIAVVIWTVVLGLGVWGFSTHRQHLKLRIVVGVTLLGQLLLHAVYGDETFLYSLHFVPLLITLAAFSTFTRARMVALGLTASLILAAGTNNLIQFNKAIELVNDQAPQRYQVLRQMKQRPTDPWPRASGHVILAVPGSLETDKAYHEPGGSFSPSVGSFGVSLWLSDSSNNIQRTSDTIPIQTINQQLNWTKDTAIPSLITKTQEYQTTWSSTDKGWVMNLITNPNPTLTTQLVIRSVGPAGGPITALDWDEKRLLINDRWSITLSGVPKKVSLGEESLKDWTREQSDRRSWTGKKGWGYARFELESGRNWTVLIQDSKAPASAKSTQGPTGRNTNPTIALDLPDPEFVTSLKAQVSHLMMGLVGSETRPGDPTNYPLAWQRDGVYTVVGLARSGKLQEAKELSNAFAVNDFFGGFGAEADAPGLSIWALEEVATHLKKPDYDTSIWPHVQRKADFILEMLSTSKTLMKSFTGPVIPKYEDDPKINLVTDAARDGLIVGRMDWQRPLLFVNAVSYRGLLDAASLADRTQHPIEAKRWRDAATALQKAWGKTFQNPIESGNDRTFISALWPTWVGTNQTVEIAQQLETRWQNRRDAAGNFLETPLWTYFDIAEAHQWLLLNPTNAQTANQTKSKIQSDRLWSTLRWFWNNQASPGLYTWWEGSGEENTFKRWENVRGWVNPAHVSPHYWTAAEMLLLQLDMLAYTDESEPQPIVVIGAGMPQDWLNKPMSAKNLPMPNGTTLSWVWDGKQMQVKIVSQTIGDKTAVRSPVRLGPLFPSGTVLKVEYAKS